MIREKDLPPDVLAKVLAHDKPTSKRAKRSKPKLVEPSCRLIRGVLTITIAVETCNENNMREWQAKHRRAGEAWKATRRAITEYGLTQLANLVFFLNRDDTIKARFTRLGGRRLDQLANLGNAFKGVEDAICYLLGIDDSDPRWQPVAPEQRPGGEVGVMVELWRAK